VICLVLTILTHFTGLSVQLRALKEIPIGDEITISYVRLDQNKADRQRQLRSDFYVKGCHCVKCDQNLDSNVDYKTFQELIEEEIYQFIDRRRVDPNYCETLASKLIPLYRSTYGDYHPFLTATLMQQSFVSRLAALRGCEPVFKWKAMFQQYYQLVDQHLRVTHGIHHPLFHIFYKTANK
jgi:hypothetical protein